jgi:ketosteroid isomerase-like protein
MRYIVYDSGRDDASDPQHGTGEQEMDDGTIAGDVRRWTEAWGREVAAADIRAGRERFDVGLLAFGTHADVVEGRDAVEAQQWAQVWPAIEDFRFDVEHLRVISSPDGLLAVAIVPWRSVGVDEAGGRFDRPGRATIVLQRAAPDAPWVGVHTHFSLARGVPATTHGRREARR